MNRQEETLYLIALSKVNGVGDVAAKKLIAYSGGTREVFEQKRSFLERIPGIGQILANAVASSDLLKEAENEIQRCEKANVKIITYLNPDYPQRLRHCDDSPIVLYTKGNFEPNPERVVSIVGTRNATRHGVETTEKLVAALADVKVTIVSGLAFGIDIAAHRAALKFGTPTIGVVAHGLHTINPTGHRNTATEMLANGGIVSDFGMGSPAMPENFPSRNRIIAGMADATIVVESAAKGGSLITADVANSYNRDVFAVPGRVSDVYSEGCNRLIKDLKAALISSGDDVLKAMGWQLNPNESKQRKQTKLLIDLTPDQEKVVSVLRQQNQTIDRLAVLSELPMSKVASVLLELEFEGVVSNLPGKVYKLN